MSVLAHHYHEPYKAPAGILALAVHAAFFSLIYFGVSWRADPPQGMMVEIWESLPMAESEPVEAPPIEQVVEPPQPVEPPKKIEEPPKPVETRKSAEPEPLPEPSKAEIELAEKKKKLKDKQLEDEKRKKAEETKKQAEQKKLETEKAAKAEQERMRAEQERVRAEQERIRAEQVAAIGKVVDEHKARIIAKIRRNIVMPPDVPDNARAEFDVTLLPGGSVLNVRLAKSSGKDAYDSAVERAIFKSQPLPLPADVALFNKFRELRLKFSPVE